MTAARIARAALLLILPLCCTFALGCASIGQRLDRLTNRSEAAAVLFFVDGLDQQHLHAALAAGKLPNIQRFFVDGGVEAPRTIVSLPSITYVNTASLLTGCYPSRHGIYGNAWFDPTTVFYRDYTTAETFRLVNEDIRVPTIYERLKGLFTVNVQCHTRRGANVTIDNTVLNGIDWWLGDFDSVDRRAGASLGEVVDAAEQQGSWPVLTTFYFPGTDETAHRYGPDSPRYARSVQVVDEQIGRVVQTLEAHPPVERMYFALVTDHGMVQTAPEHHVDLAAWLRSERDLKVAERPELPERRGERRQALDSDDAVVVVGAYRRVAIHLRGDEGWGTAVSKQRLRSFLSGANGELPLVDAPGVGLVCFRDKPGRIMVDTRDGGIAIEQKTVDGRTEYRMTDGFWKLHTPLSEIPADVISNDWRTPEEWLELTADSGYPDFAPQLFELFSISRSGDVIVFAADDWSFEMKQPGGHGSPLADEMRVSTFFRGPDLPPGTQLGPTHLVDITPTLIDLIDEGGRLHASPPMDGRSLAHDLRTAEPATP